ncbi:MAG: hypothetical protein VKM98_11140 [Cyanobacteriota bacterium]|nr:hypothetical protein [Cyanobacteriota bacterium]
MRAPNLAGSLVAILVGSGNPCWAQSPDTAQAAPAPAPAPAGSLQQRQALMRQITLQQQSLLEQRSRCINRAGTLPELERCERGYPTMMPLWHQRGTMGGWNCPMW